MGLKLSITLGGEKQLSAELLFAAEGVKDFFVPLSKVTSELQKTFQMNFAARGAVLQPGGWAPRKRAYPWPLLEKTGRLRRSFSDQVGKTEAVIFNSAPYFRWHQTGTSRLPQRLLMKVDAERRNMVIKTFQQYLVGVIRKRG